MFASWYYTWDDAIGNNPRLLKSGETPPEAYGDLWGRFLSGADRVGEIKNRRKDGTTFWVDFPVACDAAHPGQ